MARPIVEGDGVVAICCRTFENGAASGHQHKVGSQTVVTPMVVGDGLVVRHRVVEAESEDAYLAACARVGGEFTVEVEEVEGQTSVNVRVEELGSFGEVRVFGGKQVGDGGFGVCGFFLQRSPY